jgi:hypothetical protein
MSMLPFQKAMYKSCLWRQQSLQKDMLSRRNGACRHGKTITPNATCEVRTLSSVLTRHNFQCPDTLYFLSVCTLILLPSLIFTSGPYFPVLPIHLLQFRRQFRHPVRLWVCSSFCSLFSFPPSVTAPKYKPQHVTNC